MSRSTGHLSLPSRPSGTRGVNECRPAATADAPLQRLIEAGTFRPVFILGQHRSGTTLLYRCLEMNGCFNPVTVYHLLRYDELLANHLNRREEDAKQELNRQLESRGVLTRVIDDTPVSADHPEEYCFFLATRRGGWTLKPTNRALFDELCRKVQLIGSPQCPVLLKNPWDFLNFLYIHEAWPEARFVFIHRHPLDIINSQLKALRSSWLEPNAFLELLSAKYAWVQRSPAFRLFVRCALSEREPLHVLRRYFAHKLNARRNDFRRVIPRLPGDLYTSIRYEELCRDPQGSTGAILKFLGLQPKKAVDYRAFIQCRPRQLEPDIESVKAGLCRQFQCAVDKDGYEI